MPTQTGPRAARAATSLPCLRKDFLFEPYQVFEAARRPDGTADHLILAVGNDGQFARYCEIIGKPDGEWGPLFAGLAQQVAEAPPMRPKPQTQDELLGLFSADSVGRNVVLEPATVRDMMGRDETTRPTLEVVYDPQ